MRQAFPCGAPSLPRALAQPPGEGPAGSGRARLPAAQPQSPLLSVHGADAATHSFSAVGRKGLVRGEQGGKSGHANPGSSDLTSGNASIQHSHTCAPVMHTLVHTREHTTSPCRAHTRARAHAVCGSRAGKHPLAGEVRTQEGGAQALGAGLGGVQASRQPLGSGAAAGKPPRSHCGTEDKRQAGAQIPLL